MINRKEVIIITSHFRPNVGGVETHLSDLVSALTKRGWKVIVSTYQPLMAETRGQNRESGKGYEIYRLAWPGFGLVHTLFKYPALEFVYLVPGLLYQTWLLLRSHRRVNILHAQGLAPAVVALVLGRLFGKRIIVSTHNLYFFPKSGIYTQFSKFVFSRFDVVLTLSDASAEELVGIGVPFSKIRPFRYWLNLKLFSPKDPAPIRKAKDLPAGFIAFFVGRLIETKGILLILEMAKRLTKINFVVAGPGPLVNRVEAFAQGHPNLRYVGPLSQEEVCDYMNASDVVIVPALVPEGYGRTAMEPLACGVPVLATKIGGLDEVVNNSVGRLVKPQAKEFVTALVKLSTDRRVLRLLKKNARPYAVRTFSERNVGNIIAAYKS